MKKGVERTQIARVFVAKIGFGEIRTDHIMHPNWSLESVCIMLYLRYLVSQYILHGLSVPVLHFPGT